MATKKNIEAENIEIAIVEVTENYLRDIRGRKVMLDSDLAEIYGYETKGLNRQVKNNIDKFDEDFMFELTDEEVEDLRCKNCTANIDSKSRYNPHVFTEQKNAPAEVEIKLFSDNIGSRKLHNVEYSDFLREYSGLQITLQRTGGVFHDRFIVLDYGTEDERVFLCGSSSKDAGARITTIVEDFGIRKYDQIVRKLLTNEVLVLP